MPSRLHSLRKMIILLRGTKDHTKSPVCAECIEIGDGNYMLLYSRERLPFPFLVSFPFVINHKLRNVKKTY